MKNVLTKGVFVILFFYAKPIFSQNFDGGLFLALHTLTQNDVDNNITNPVVGNLIFNTTTNTLMFYSIDNEWINVRKMDPIVENELYFDDESYHYVSMKINSTDYKVVRYSRSNVNIEAFATGTGAQPTQLSEITSLTFN